MLIGARKTLTGHVFCGLIVAHIQDVAAVSHTHLSIIFFTRIFQALCLGEAYNTLWDINVPLSDRTIKWVFISR